MKMSTLLGASILLLVSGQVNTALIDQFNDVSGTGHLSADLQTEEAQTFTVCASGCDSTSIPSSISFGLVVTVGPAFINNQV